jgi:hypothetical protein
MAPYAVDGETPTPYEDIPGRGRFSGREGVVGYGARLYQETVEGKGSTPGDLYAVGRDIANMKIREAAGLSQTTAEIERVRPVLEGEFGSDPARMHEAIMSVQRAYEQDLADLKAGTSRQVLQRYEANAGDKSVFSRPQTYLEFPKAGGQAPQPSPSPMPAPTGKKSIRELTPAQIDKMSAEELSQYDF